MSWYLEYDKGSGKWMRDLTNTTVAPGSGPYTTEADAAAALVKRADWSGLPLSRYRVVQQRDTVVEPPKVESKSLLPTDKQVRKEMPIARGVLGYFPLAIAAVANVSFVGNQQHNPGQPMHWARGKSTDHADCIVRHLIEAGTIDDDGLRHTAKLAWRALALLQEELEAANGK